MCKSIYTIVANNYPSTKDMENSASVRAVSRMLWRHSCVDVSVNAALTWPFFLLRIASTSGLPLVLGFFGISTVTSKIIRISLRSKLYKYQQKMHRHLCKRKPFLNQLTRKYLFVCLFLVSVASIRTNSLEELIGMSTRQLWLVMLFRTLTQARTDTRYNCGIYKVGIGWVIFIRWWSLSTCVTGWQPVIHCTLTMKSEYGRTRTSISVTEGELHLIQSVFWKLNCSE